MKMTTLNRGTACIPARPSSILDLPPELRLTVYEYCAGVQTRSHIIVVEPRKLSFQIVLKATNIQILSTCRIIHTEARSVFEQDLDEILAFPARLIAGSNLVESQVLCPSILNALHKSVVRATRKLDGGTGGPLSLLMSKRDTIGYHFSQDDLVKLGCLIMHATLRHRRLLDCTPSVEIGLHFDESQADKSWVLMRQATVKVDMWSNNRLQSYGFRTMCRVLVTLNGLADKEEEARFSSYVQRCCYWIRPGVLPIDIVVEEEEYAREWV